MVSIPLRMWKEMVGKIQSLSMEQYQSTRNYTAVCRRLPEATARLEQIEKKLTKETNTAPCQRTDQEERGNAAPCNRDDSREQLQRLTAPDETRNLKKQN